MLSSMDTYMLLSGTSVREKLRRMPCAYCDITGCFVLGYEVFAAIEIFE